MMMPFCWPVIDDNWTAEYVLTIGMLLKTTRGNHNYETMIIC